jgi:hypothetical protein
MAAAALAEKNKLTAPDARLVEVAFELRLSAFAEQPLSETPGKSFRTADVARPHLDSHRSPAAAVALLDGQGVPVASDRGARSGIDNAC